MAIMALLFSFCTTMIAPIEANARDRNKGGVYFSFGFGFGDKFSEPRRRRAKTFCEDKLKYRRRGIFLVTTCRRCTFKRRHRRSWNDYGSRRNRSRCEVISRERRRID